MATITRQDIDALNLTLTVNIAKEDYIDKFNRELKRYSSQAALKGFRKGKTPMTVVRKMFGRQLLADVINKELDKSLSDYLFEENKELQILGQPIPAEDQAEIDFNPASPGDFEFKFDLGLAPQVALDFLGKGGPYERLAVQPEDAFIQEELEKMRKRAGRSEEVDAPVEENDIITVNAVEMEGDVVKENGVTAEFTLFVNNTSQEVKDAFLGKSVGVSGVFNIYEVESGVSRNHVHKYLLDIDEDDMEGVGEIFQLTVTKVSRAKLADWDEAFFKEAFGEETTISTEEEAMAELRNSYKEYFSNQTEAYLFRQIQDDWLESVDMEFPETFLKRWLVLSNERNTPESVERGFDTFRKSLKWTVIRDELVSHFKLEVSDAEIRNEFAAQVMGYFGGSRPEWMDDSFIDNMVDRMMKESKDVREKAEDILQVKLAKAVLPLYNTEERTVTPDEFSAIIDALRAENLDAGIYYDEEE
ncbi:MAG: trigger factor [Saprospiraceae bacterium]